DACSSVSLSLDITAFDCGDVGTQTVVLSVEDEYNNISTCEATITVADTIAPVALCQAAVVQLNSNGQGNLVIADIDAGSTDACGVSSLMVDDNQFDCDQVGNNQVTLTVTDANGNSSSCVATVTVEDNIAPEALCQNTTVQLASNGVGVLTPAAVNNGSSDACGIDTVYLDQTTFGCGDIGIQTVILTIVDENGNSSTCNAEVTIEDNIGPDALCQNVTVQLDATGNGTLTPAQVDNGTNDACGISGLFLSEDTFSCDDVGPNTVTLFATDTHGNGGTCTATITVVDNVAPEALCQDLTVALDAGGTGNIQAIEVDNGSSDACGIDNLALDITSFGCDQVGINPVVLTVTDVNGNVDSCTAIITVEDNTAPEALCQAVTVQLDGTGTGVLNPADMDAGSSDACGIANLSVSQGTFSCEEVGTTLITLTVTDVNGNLDSCTALITIEDNVVPIALCQDAVVQLNADGVGLLSPADVDGGSGGACGVDNLVLSEDTFDCADLGPNFVTLIVIDINGNASTCLSTVTVEDNVAPNALCQDITVQLDADGLVSLTAAQVDSNSFDACGIDSISIDDTTFDCDDVGPNAVTLTVTDINGNAGTCSALVTIEDNVAPETLCQDIVVQLDADGLAAIDGNQIDNGSDDACGIATLSVDITSFDCSDVGPNTVVLTATDVNGNSDTCSALVTIADTVAPDMICNDITIQLDPSGVVSITADQVDGSSSDACGLSNLALDDPNFDCSNVGANTVTLIGIDVNGNTGTCTATVTVEDITAPEALCQDITVQLNVSGNTTLNPAQVDAGSNDACGIGNLSLNLFAFDCDDVGDNIIALTVVDENGNASSCTAIVSVEDQTAPEALCQDVTVQLDDSGNGSLAANQVDAGASDACGVDLYTLDVSTFDCDDIGLNQVVLTVTDVNGNSSTCDAIVTVEDEQAPLALCQNATVQLDVTGTAFLAPAQIDAGSSDACGIATQALNITVFDCSDIGANQVALTIMDVNGNSSTCTSTVIVADTVAPVALCTNITAQLDSNGMVMLTPDQLDNGSSDACGIANRSLDLTTFDCQDLGLNIVTLTVTDVNGNSSSCTSAVTVEDNFAPTALCQDVLVVLSGTGQGSITVADINAGSFDACGIANTALSRTTFDCDDVGEVLVVLTVSDVNGNSSFCGATVTVQDNTAPVALCQDVTVELDASGNGSTSAAEVSAGYIDACGIGSLELDQTEFDCADVGPNTVTLTQTDENGNVGTCTATVMVEDHGAPLALCQDVTVQLDEDGAGVLPPAFVDAGSSDVCGIDWISLNQTQFDCSHLGQNTVTLTVADIYGNLSTCTSTATVEDNIAPVAQCQNVIVEPVSDDAYGLVAADFDNGSTDNCGIGSFTVNVSTLSCEDFGLNPVTLTVMDNSGNTSTCQAFAIVQDFNGPTAICPDDIIVDTDPGSCDAVVEYDPIEAVFVCDEAVSSDTLEFNGTMQTFVVPQGVTSLKIEAYGAQGGNANVGFGGLGAYMSGTFAVTPGQIIDVLVGETPANSNGGGGGTFIV
ncbi:MAG: hypothetical protein HRU12_25070, partial [Phaeodactylibacter sp.]|nr:hypothetical protein [Phaeodactylibacter sp.]